jgi:hypothetical protein
MRKQKIYLDICCFNRPYDDQSQLKIELETKAKLYIQKLIEDGLVSLAWSYILDYENSKNAHPQKQDTIKEWQSFAIEDIEETSEILLLSKTIQKNRDKEY